MYISLSQHITFYKIIDYWLLLERSELVKQYPELYLMEATG